jgi:cell wall-associated NlpC family hydrolase
MRAIIGQESGGKFNIVNPHSGALGYGQVMPANVPSWTMEALGYELSTHAFLNSPKLQIKTIKFQLQKAWNSQAGVATEEEQVRRVASIWYSGQSRLWNNTKPQFYKGHPYPSIADYTKSVWRKYQRELTQAQSEPSRTATGQQANLSALVSNSATAQQVVAQAMTWRGKHFKQGQTARCADFVRTVLREVGISVSVSDNPVDKAQQWNGAHPLRAQSFFGTDVGDIIWNKNDLRPGDLIGFANTYGNWAKGSITHVGIYIGNGMMIDRSTSSRPINYRSINTFTFRAGVRPHAYSRGER